MIFTVHAEIVYFLIGLVAIFAISDIYMFYLFASGGL